MGRDSSRKSESYMKKGNDMDMTWKSMLHEAAAASFEKDIKSFAVDTIS